MNLKILKSDQWRSFVLELFMCMQLKVISTGIKPNMRERRLDVPSVTGDTTWHTAPKTPNME